MILQPHKHAFRAILLVIFLASFALFLFVNFREQKSNTAVGVTCPAGIAGQMDLCPSTRIPHQGDTVQFTANTRQSQSGIAITIYIGGRPGADGYITNPQILTTGSTNSSGNFDFSYTVPSGDAWNTMHYFRAEAQVNGVTLKSNQAPLTVIPKTTDANWILTPSTYCHVVGGVCTPINNSKPIDKVYPLAATGEVILLEDGQYSYAEFDRSCHSQTGPMIWVMARNINGPVFTPNPVGSSDTIAFYKKACWTSLVGLKIMGDDRSAVQFVTSTNNGPYLSNQFLEITIDGGYDWYNKTGTTGKWGIQSYGLQGFRYIGGSVRNIGDATVGEHVLYAHNADTDASGYAVEMRDVDASNFGRTYVQFVNRSNDCSYANPCPPGSGNLQIEHATIRNNGLEGGCTGGAALTFAGRNDYNIIVSNVYVESGLDPGLSCVGTEEFVTWDGNNVPAENNGPTTIRNSYFIMAPNQGNKPLSEMGTVDSITVEKSTFISGKTYSMNAKKSATTKCFDRDSNITGNPEKRVTYDGIDYANYQAMLDAVGDCGSSGSNPTVTLSANDANASESAGDPGNFIITRTGSTANSLTVNFSVSGTATNGSDYTSINSPVTIPVGASSVNVPATIIDDTAVESSETVILTLTSSASYIIGSPNTGTVTIADNDSAGLPTVTISATDPNASESGDPGTFVFTRTGSITNGLLVYISISGTATNGIDYPDLPSSILIPAGNSSLSIDGFPIDDTLVEPSETVTLTFLPYSSYTIGSPNSATITIADNDSSGTPTITINADDPTASELGSDTGIFTISRTGSTANPLTAFFTISGSAINGSDYQQMASSITIPSGSSYSSITLAPIDDSTIENTETATLTLSSDSSYLIGTQNTASVNILDNDGNSGQSSQTTPPTQTNNQTNTALSPAPSNFSGLALTPDKVYLSWNLISGASGIELSEGLDATTFNKIYNLPGNYYYYKPSVTPGSTHAYKIRSYDSSGNFSEFSNIVQISTTNSVAQFTKSLYYGIDDPQVSLLQQCLKNDSSIYPSGKITGHFGPLTEAGVKKFQSKYGINPIGIVGPLTRAKLNTSCASVSAIFSSTPSLTSTVKPASVNYNLNFDLILGIGSSND